MFKLFKKRKNKWKLKMNDKLYTYIRYNINTIEF